MVLPASGQARHFWDFGDFWDFRDSSICSFHFFNLLHLSKRMDHEKQQTGFQSIARGLFQLSRRDRELLPFSLMLRDEIENFFLSVSCFETRSRISSFQSHASRRDREFLPFSLMLRDEVENFFLSVSCFETRSRI